MEAEVRVLELDACNSSWKGQLSPAMLCTQWGPPATWLLLGEMFILSPACLPCRETEALREVRAGQRALATKSQLTFDQLGEAQREGASRVTWLPCMAAQVVHCTKDYRLVSLKAVSRSQGRCFCS